MSIRPIGGMRRGVVTVNLGRRADQSERRGSRQADRRDRPDDRDEDDEHKDNDRKPRSRWPLIILGVVVAAVIGGIVYWLMTRGEVTTDDAYTKGNAIAFAPQVSGYVVQLNVDDNTVVHKGDLLLRIDQREYVAAATRPPPISRWRNRNCPVPRSSWPLPASVRRRP